jgi:hypothetical protein
VLAAHGDPRRRPSSTSLLVSAAPLSASLLLLVRRLVFGEFEVFVTSFAPGEFYAAS